MKEVRVRNAGMRNPVFLFSDVPDKAKHFSFFLVGLSWHAVTQQKQELFAMKRYPYSRVQLYT